MSPVRLATRPSKLAMKQAGMVASLLNEMGMSVDILEVSSRGDSDRTSPLFRIGGAGVFVEEINRKILQGEADIAVHSAKDLPSQLPDELEIIAVLAREKPVDVLISRSDLASLPSGSVIGTSSIRRIHELGFVRGDLKVENLRGNLDTRIEKFNSGLYDGIIVAKAGLARLEIDVPHFELDTGDFLPAPNQGIIAVVCRKDFQIKHKISYISDDQAFFELSAERRLVSRLHLGCSLPAAVLCEKTQAGYRIKCRFYSLTSREFKEFSRLFRDLEEIDSLATEITEKIPDSYGYNFRKGR